MDVGGIYIKKFIFFVCIILVVICFIGYTQKGNTDKVKLSIGKSDKFSKVEINSAIDCIEKKFKEYEGCTLTKLWYDEKVSNDNIKDYLKTGRGSVNGVKEQNVIVFMSEFDVGSSGPVGFGTNSTYGGWAWILIRDSKTGNWRVDDSGY